MAFFTKSLFTKKAVTDAQWASLIDYMSGEGTTSGRFWYVEIDRKLSHLVTLGSKADCCI